MPASKTFTFNRPWTLVFLLPLAFLIFMLFQGLSNEFSFFVLVMVIATTCLLFLFALMSVMRRITIGAGKVIWKTPFTKREFDLKEIESFGIVKFRKFRFIYFSKLENPPYDKHDTAVVSNEETVVLQFRQSAWSHVVEVMKASKPDLKPKSFS